MSYREYRSPKREERVPYGRAIPNEPPKKTKQKSPVVFWQI